MSEDPGEGARPGRPFLARVAVDIRPLRECRDFRRLWFGTGISAIGSQITTVAIPFQVYALTDSTAIVGLLGLAAVFPLLTVPLYAGAVADAVDRRLLLLASDIALLLVTVGLLVNALLPSPSVALLFVAEILGTAAYAFQRPARNALIPRLVPRELFSAAIAVEDVVFNLARVGGPALAGLLIAVVGLAGAYALDLCVRRGGAVGARDRRVRLHGRSLACTRDAGRRRGRRLRQRAPPLHDHARGDAGLDAGPDVRDRARAGRERSGARQLRGGSGRLARQPPFLDRFGWTRMRRRDGADRAHAPGVAPL
ncbi:MAG: MFS transporter [Actinobacteria bacterium]|nr:MFS transporter [Actinomycetota bacterium]